MSNQPIMNPDKPTPPTPPPAPGTPNPPQKRNPWIIAAAVVVVLCCLGCLALLGFQYWLQNSNITLVSILHSAA